MRAGMFFSIGIEQMDYPRSFVWPFISHLFDNDFISLASSTLSAFLIAYIISQINIAFNIIRFRTTLPFSLSIFFLSIHPSLLSMSPNYISVILILLGLPHLLHSYQRSFSQNLAFKSGILIALAGTFQMFSLFFVLLWWIGQVSMHRFQIRSLLSSILGILLVFLNVGGLFYYFDKVEDFILYFTVMPKIEMSFMQYTITQYIEIAVLISFTIIILIANLKVYLRDRVLTRKTMGFIGLIIIFSLLLHVAYSTSTTLFLIIDITLISFVISYYYSFMKHKWQLYSFFLLMSTASIFYLNYLVGNPFEIL